MSGTFVFRLRSQMCRKCFSRQMFSLYFSRHYPVAKAAALIPVCWCACLLLNGSLATSIRAQQYKKCFLSLNAQEAQPFLKTAATRVSQKTSRRQACWKDNLARRIASPSPYSHPKLILVNDQAQQKEYIFPRSAYHSYSLVR